MTNISTDNLTKNYLTPYRILTVMSIIGTQELPFEELEYGMLIDLIREFQNGTIRKPDHFNQLHFLLLLLYDAHGYPRDRYPLWRWYHRIKKKLFTARHLTIETMNSRQYIFQYLEDLANTNININSLIEESVQLEEHYLNSPIHGLFKSYTPLHTYLYFEQIDKLIIPDNSKISQLFHESFKKYYRNEYCDLIHFCIAHRKRNFLEKIFQEKINWLNLSMNLTTQRGWLPLHYAAYVGDKDIVRCICDALTSPTLPIHFDTISLLIPNFKQILFEKNPHEYILKISGFESLSHPSKSRKFSNIQRNSIDPQQNLLKDQYFRTNFDIRDQPTLSNNIFNNSNLNISTDIDIPDADELELSVLPLIQRDEFIEKILHMYDTKRMLIPSPLTLACMATCSNLIDYEDIVRILLDSHLVEFDGLNHESILGQVLDYMHRNDYASFQHVQVYRDTETEGPSTFIFYQFDGFIVNQDVKPLSGALSGSSITLNTSKNDESGTSDDGQPTETPISVRCFLTILVLQDIFLQYPRWDFHLLRENIEEHFSELETALGCRPTILYPDGEIISSRKRSDVTWEMNVKYRLGSETGQTLYMQVDYYFFETFGDPLADGFVNVYQTPFYISCMTNSMIMMDLIFDSFFKRRHLHYWGTIAQKHLEHCFDGLLQMKDKYETFLCLCRTLSRYYQVEGDPFIEENSSTIQRIFVHAFACCVRRNAKIELDYLIKNHALIYYDSCRTKPSDIRHNILTYCVVRNLAVVFDQLMTNMKTTMYKTYQNSTNPDWQPHIAWREIIHLIIDPILLQANGSNDQNDFSQFAAYGDTNISFASIGTIPILHTTGNEYKRCITTRKNIILKTKRRLPRTGSDRNKNQSITPRMNSFDQQQITESIRCSPAIQRNSNNESDYIRHNSDNSGIIETTTGSLTKRSRNIFKNVNRFRWSNKQDGQNSLASQENSRNQINSPTVTTGLDEITTAVDTISLSDVNDSELNEDEQEKVLNSTVNSILIQPNKFQRRRTIHGIRTRQDLSHRTALKHLRSIFQSNRGKNKIEQEQILMINKNLRRTSSISNEINSLNKIREHRISRRSDTINIS